MSKKDDIRAEILNTAERLFEKYGYDKTTVEDISGESNKGKTAVYYYFKSKSEIFHKVLDNEFLNIRKRLEAFRKDNHADRMSELRDYLKLRMELIRSAAVYSRYLSLHHLHHGGEVYSIIRSVRDDFDSWEREYFQEICREGNDRGLLSDKVRPESFGEMLEMLLKGLEIQFANTKDAEHSKSTYEEVLDRILLGCTIQNK